MSDQRDNLPDIGAMNAWFTSGQSKKGDLAIDIPFKPMVTETQVIETPEGTCTRRVTWTEEGALLPPEEKKKILDDIEKRVAADHANTVSIPVSQLLDIYDRFSQLTKLGQSDYRTYMEQSEEVRALKGKVFELAEFGAVFAGQWLPREVMNEYRSKQKTPT